MFEIEEYFLKLLVLNLYEFVIQEAWAFVK